MSDNGHPDILLQHHRADEGPRNAPFVAVIILNWNGWKDTIECLERLRSIDYPNCAVMVVDNGSKDDSVDRIRAWAERSYINLMDVAITTDTSVSGRLTLATWPASVTLIRSPDNLGFAGGVNLGMRCALLGHENPKPDYILLLNNDVSVPSNFLRNIVGTAVQADAAITGALVLDETGSKVVFARTSFPHELFFAPRHSIPAGNETTWQSFRAEASAMLLRSDLLDLRYQAAGYYLDPTLFMYCEEIDLAYFARSNGLKCVITKKATAYHKIGHSSGGVGNPRSYYYVTRNRVYLARKMLSVPLLLLFHPWYITTRFLRILQFWLAGRTSVASAVCAGLTDGYAGRMGKWGKH